MSKNYFLAIAQYEDEKKQSLFDNIISKRNKEYCKIHDLEYLEITSGAVSYTHLTLPTISSV